MAIHPWWADFGQPIQTADQLTPAPARELASALAESRLPGATLVALKQSDETGYAAVQFEVDVERPQDLAYPIKATEPVAALFPFDAGMPRVMALRDDFPDTLHQNWTPPDSPVSICIDDRPWAEAKLTSTPADLVRRVQLWLAKAARGELHDPAQPPEPMFFPSPLALVLPAQALAASIDPVELVGFVRSDNPRLVLTRSASEIAKGKPIQPAFTVVAFQVPPQSMTRLQHAPVTLAALADQIQRCGIDLLGDLKARLKTWAGLESENVRRLASRLAIVIAFPVTTGHRTATDLRAFITDDIAGDVGVALGVLYQNESRVGAKEAYVAAIGAETPSGKALPINPAQVHFAFDRALAAAVAGRGAPDRRRAVLVGAGALGSQIGIDLAREGAFSWSVVDQDYLLPHNLARHALFSGDVGAPKAPALARQMSGLLNEPVAALCCDVTAPDDGAKEQLVTAFADADVVVDASASVAVSRHLSDLDDTKARRVCAFFNPAGTAAVLLVESAGRAIALRDLEAQYHRLVLTEPLLADHLHTEREGVRYSGSCRALTNRIPATKAALLSALAARGIADGVAGDGASIRIWNVSDDGQVRLVKRDGASVHHIDLGAWRISYDSGLLADLSRLRESRLPDETGGVLLGIADMSRKSIHVAHAMPPPEDSRGSPAGFERGIVGLLAEVSRATEASMHQLRYVGEWHSHPRRSSPLPSGVDLQQLAWLGSELENERLPALMAIAADDGAFAFVLAATRTADRPAGERRQAG
jgi:hypothetical protein